MLLKNKKGFTLIELLVVIAIIGILATIVLVSLNTARVKARDTRRLSDMQQLSLAMEMYYDKYNSVYYDGTDFSSYVTALQSATLIGATPVDPSNSGSQVYVARDGSTSAYCFYTQLESTANHWAIASEDGAGKRSSASAPAVDGCGPNL